MFYCDITVIKENTGDTWDQLAQRMGTAKGTLRRAAAGAVIRIDTIGKPGFAINLDARAPELVRDLRDAADELVRRRVFNGDRAAIWLAAHGRAGLGERAVVNRKIIERILGDAAQAHATKLDWIEREYELWIRLIATPDRDRSSQD